MLTLNSPIGTNHRVDPDDLMDTKRALSDLGYYDVPPHRGIDDWTDDATFDGIKRFQQDNGLKVDGLVRPGGPTETTINKHIRLAANSRGQGRPRDAGWEHRSDMDAGDDKEFDVKGPIRVDTHNPSAGVNGARYHVDWYALDENGNPIPEYRNANKAPEAYPGHVPPFGTNEKIFDPPYPSSNGHRVRVWYPPQPEYSNHPGTPYLKVYRKKRP
jgi:Putative peptidoglycan binding domain.